MSSEVPDPFEQPPSLPSRGTRKVRGLGWLLLVLGSALSLGMAVLAGYLHDTIAHNHDATSHSHWHGGPAFTRTVFELFGAVFLFGVIALSAGVFQVATGRRNRFLMILLLIAVVAIVYLGYGITSTRTPGD